MNNIELRFVDFAVETSNSDDLTVKGYVNEVGKYSHTLGIRKKFKERILPGAFTRALSHNEDIHFLAEHDANKILASTRNNSLKLVEDEKGLFMEATISPTSYGRDYHTLIKDGILRNMSFGFNVVKDSWRKMNDGTYTRDISDLKLFEVSVVTNPAYPQSTISARGLHVVEEVEIPQEVEDMEDKNLEEKELKQVEEVAKEVSEAIEKTKENLEEEKEQEVVEETKKEVKQESRAYIGGMYDDRDIMNACLDLSAQCLSLAKHFSKNNIFTERIKPLKDMAISCNEIMVGLVVEPQQTEGGVVATRSEENSEIDEKGNVTIKAESVEVEKRDLTELYSMLDSLKRKGE